MCKPAMLMTPVADVPSCDISILLVALPDPFKLPAGDGEVGWQDPDGETPRDLGMECGEDRDLSVVLYHRVHLSKLQFS